MKKNKLDAASKAILGIGALVVLAWLSFWGLIIWGIYRLIVTFLI